MNLSLAVMALLPIASMSKGASGSFFRLGSDGAIDLSKDIEESQSLNESSGALSVIHAAEGHSQIRTAIVIENGELVVSYARDDVDPSAPFSLYSATKSVTSLLVGVLLKEGALSSLDETLGDIFTDESVWEGVPDAELRKGITMKEMLTMTSGLVSEDSHWIPDECDLTAWLAIPLTGVRGEFSYLIVSNILSYVILEKSGMTPRELLSAKVLSPLGIKDDDIDWPTTFPGECVFSESSESPQVQPAYHGLSLTALQMAKIGMLYSNEGSAGPNEVVVNSDYIKESLTEHTVTDEVFGVGNGYGYLWIGLTQYFGGTNIWCAIGYGGQFMCVDTVHDRVTIQQRDPDTSDTGQLSYSWPALVALDPTLSFFDKQGVAQEW